MEPGPRRDPAGLPTKIADEIRARGPIPFARFMDLALNDPVLGYYAKGGERLGPGGDFFTASDVGTLFGECVARQLLEMDVRLGRPSPFAYVEIGAGRGLLAKDVAEEAARLDEDFARRLDLLLVDSSAAMRSLAARTVPRAQVRGPESLGGGRTGCVVAVELFDALPVHRVRRREGRLREVYVALEDGRLTEVEADPTPAARELAERYGAAPAEGDEAEVSPGARAVVRSLASALDRGFALIVDYGYRAPDLYGPERSRGTLLAYHRHAASEDLLARVGEQDLTAHVNFSSIEDEARDAGLEVLGLTTQDRFLIANGILRHFEDGDPERWGDPARVRARLRAMQLIHPDAMGRAFKVLILSKGVAPRPALAGLEDPFASGRAARPSSR